MSADARRVAELIRDGRKLEAIKLLRSMTGLDLKEAAEQVERIAADMAADTTEAVPDTTVREHSDIDDVRAEAVELIRQGRSIEAVKLIRERTGLGLKEAVQQVDALESEAGTADSGDMRQMMTRAREASAEAKRLLAQGKREEAITLIQETTNYDRARAEKMADRMAQNNKGCTRVVFVIALVIMLAVAGMVLAISLDR